jgi:anoctamin-10
MLGGLIAICFGIEIFISEVYTGPFKGGLVFLPTGILTTMIPTLTTLLGGFASKLNNFENYETIDAYEAGTIRKQFVFNFITGYMGIFLTAFVYVPFGSLIVPHLDVFALTVKPFAEHEDDLKAPSAGFEINPDRLRKQVIYFTVTAQIVNLAMEVVVPYVKRKVFQKVKSVQADRAANKGGEKAPVGINDHPEEAAFLTRVRNESELDHYDVNNDLREMVMQVSFGDTLF